MPNITLSQATFQPTVETSQSTTDPKRPYQRRFDEATWRQLDGYDFRILDHLNYLSRIQAKKSPTGASYCHPSEKWLAKKLQVRRECISRHVCKLVRLGILDRTRRRKLHGKWQTNLYKVAKWVVWRLRAALSPLRETNKPCAPRRTHSTPIGVELEPKTPKGAPSAIKETLTNLFERLKRGESLPET